MDTTRTMTVGMLLSCDSFESFYGTVLQLDRDKFLKSYRNDWSWYYARGLVDNGIRPILYLPSIHYDGLYETDVGVSVRFLRLAAWFRPFASLRKAMRISRWSLYAQERINAAAFLKPLNDAIAADGTNLLYVQEYWGGRFDHLIDRVNVPVTAVDQGGVSQGVVTWFKRAALGKAAVLYCQTRDECAQVERHGGRPMLLPNGGDTSFFSPPPPGSRQQKNIVTVARLTDKQKRTSDLIRSMKLLEDEWTLDVIGRGPDQEMLEALAAELGVASRVRFRGFQSQAAVRTFNQQCGVYAMPSENEGVCLALLEAMGCGAAIVASRIRAFSALVTDGTNGKTFPVGDVPALAAAIKAAWTERDTLGPAAAVSVAEQFNAKTLYQRLAESMRQAARRSPHVSDPSRTMATV